MNSSEIINLAAKKAKEIKDEVTTPGEMFLVASQIKLIVEGWIHRMMAEKAIERDHEKERVQDHKRF